MSERVALAHDWFVNRGGAERVALNLAAIYQQAPMFTALAFPQASFPEIQQLDLRVSKLQNKVTEAERFRRFLMSYPAAWEAFDANGFDAVIASTSAFAHHLRTDGCMIAYCYQPPRFLYDLQISTGLAPGWARPVLPLALRRLRAKDRAAAARVHRYLAVSKGAAKRIEAVYGVRATPVYPPVDVARFSIAPRTADYWLLVSRLVPHRDVALAIEAFNELGWPLVIVGDGPDRSRLQSMAEGSITFAGTIDDAQLLRMYGECRGAVVPGVDDFGLIALEANASGRPVVARGAGGSLETVIDGVTGVLFPEATSKSLARALRRAATFEVDPGVLRSHAMRFDKSVFEAKIKEVVAARTTCLACQRNLR